MGLALRPRAELTEVPPDLPVVYREALMLANKATFTQEELDAYEKVRDEIQQVLVIAEARWVEGQAEGHVEGEIKGRRDTLLRLLARAGIAVTDGDHALIQACTSVTTLDRWIDSVFGAKTAADVLS